MKPACFILVLLMLISCQKKEDYKPVFTTYTAPDFELIPMKDATWHIRGLSDDDYPSLFYNTYGVNYEGVKASGYYNLIDLYINTTNKDTLVGIHKYYFYKYTMTVSSVGADTIRGTQTHSGGFYLRGDTTTMKVYSTNDSVAIDFSNDANKGTIIPFYGWTDMKIMHPDSLLLGGCYLKRWNMQNMEDPKSIYFDKAIGIGTPAGLFPTAFIGQVTSLDFTYKGENAHFEFPLE